MAMNSISGVMMPCARVVHLRHAATGLGAQRRATQRRKIFEAALFFLARLVGGVKRQVAIVDRLQFAAFVFFNVAARQESNRGATTADLRAHRTASPDRPTVHSCRKRAPAGSLQASCRNCAFGFARFRERERARRAVRRRCRCVANLATACRDACRCFVSAGLIAALICELS